MSAKPILTDDEDGVRYARYSQWLWRASYIDSPNGGCGWGATPEAALEMLEKAYE